MAVGSLGAGRAQLTVRLVPSTEKPVFFSAFAAEGQKLPAETPCWTSGLPFSMPPREVIKASPHAPDPSAFSYAPPGEWLARLRWGFSAAMGNQLRHSYWAPTVCIGSNGIERT